MLERTTIGMEEMARLELAGAWDRLANAERALLDFRAEHDGSVSLSHLQSEHDIAQREYNKAKAEYARLRGR